MSARMTDEEVRAFIDAVNSMNALDVSEAHVKRAVITKIAQEISSGRSNESAKDETIRALANALWDARQYGDEVGDVCWGAAPCMGQEKRHQGCVAKEAVLLRAGRLP